MIKRILKSESIIVNRSYVSIIEIRASDLVQMHVSNSWIDDDTLLDVSGADEGEDEDHVLPNHGDNWRAYEGKGPESDSHIWSLIRNIRKPAKLSTSTQEEGQTESMIAQDKSKIKDKDI